MFDSNHINRDNNLSKPLLESINIQIKKKINLISAWGGVERRKKEKKNLSYWCNVLALHYILYGLYYSHNLHCMWYDDQINVYFKYCLILELLLKFCCVLKMMWFQVDHSSWLYQPPPPPVVTEQPKPHHYQPTYDKTYPKTLESLAEKV